MTPTDEDIKKDVVEELYWDSRIDASDIFVEVENAEVLLSGTAPTYYNAVSASDDAMGVYGVKGVRNEIQVKYPGTGPVLTDTEMRSRIQTSLISDADIDSSEIVVKVANGLVTLEGAVSALWKKFHAENIAAAKPGVIDIRNDLTVVPTKTIADREIADNILGSLKRKSVVNEQDVDVRVENGVVNLTGRVSSPIAGRAVKESARYTPGVMQVVDNLTVGTL